MKKLFCFALLSLSCLTTQAETQWSYQDVQDWGKLNPNFATCSQGKMQSPINIPTPKTLEQKNLPLTFHDDSTTREIINNGHTIEVIGAPEDTFSWNGTHYHLTQFHFHTPSENEINGHRFKGEIHFVNQSSEGKIAVIAVFLKLGHQANPALAKILSAAPKKPGEKNSLNPIKISQLIPKQSRYITFEGSLTTPPCTEGLQWIVIEEPLAISAKQLKALHQLLGHNARPIQALNQRSLTQY